MKNIANLVDASNAILAISRSALFGREIVTGHAMYVMMAMVKTTKSIFNVLMGQSK